MLGPGRGARATGRKGSKPCGLRRAVTVAAPAEDDVRPAGARTETQGWQRGGRGRAGPPVSSRDFSPCVRVRHPPLSSAAGSREHTRALPWRRPGTPWPGSSLGPHLAGAALLAPELLVLELLAPELLALELLVQELLRGAPSTSGLLPRPRDVAVRGFHFLMAAVRRSQAVGPLGPDTSPELPFLLRPGSRQRTESLARPGRLWRHQLETC